MASASALTLDSLVPLTHDVEPYVLEWPVLEEDGGEVLTLVLQRRPAVSSQPFLLDFCRKSVGPSTLVVVPLAVLDNGSLSPTGVQASVLVVDFQESVVQQMRLPLEFEEINFSFDLEQPYSIPSPPDLLMKVKYWLVGDVSSGEELDGEALEEGDVPKELLQANGASDLDTPQEERKTHSSAWARSASVAAKKPTVATLASALQQVLEPNQGMSSQLQALTQRQQVLEQQLVAIPSQSSLHPCSVLRQPISASLNQPLNQPQAIAKTLGTPARTVAPSHPGLLQSPTTKPPHLLELESEKLQPPPSTSSDPLARAVMV